MNENQFTEKVNQLTKEIIDIGEKYADKTKDFEITKNMFGQTMRIVDILDGYSAFHENDSKGNSFPNPRVIEIGNELYRLGGIELMNFVYNNVKYQFGREGVNLSVAWHVGNCPWTHG